MNPIVVAWINELRAGNPECNHKRHHRCDEGLNAYGVLAKVVGFEGTRGLTTRHRTNYPRVEDTLLEVAGIGKNSIKVAFPEDLRVQTLHSPTTAGWLSRYGVGWWTQDDHPLTHSQLADCLERFGVVDE